MGTAALDDGAAEQPLGARHGEQRADAQRAGGFAEDGDVAGIAAEGGDIVAHPFERRDLVEQAEVGDAVAEVEEAFGADAVVDGHADDAVAGEAAAVVPGAGAGAVILVHAARDPDHHRQVRRAQVLGPDVEGQAVLAGADQFREEFGNKGRIWPLGRFRAEFEGVADAAPKVRAAVGGGAGWRRPGARQRESP